MSGPKTSHLNLTPAQREALRRQRLIRAELAVLKKQLQDVHTVVVQSDRTITRLEPIWPETQKGDALQNTKTLRDNTMAALNRAAEMTEGTDLAAIQEMNREILQMSRELGALSAYLEEGYEDTLEAFRASSGEQISRGFGMDFSALTHKKADFPLQAQILSELDRVSSLNLGPEQRRGLQVLRERASHIQDETFLKNYLAVTVTPFIRECTARHEAWNRDGAEYQRKVLLLEENARILGIETPGIPFGPDALAQLEEQLRETESAITFREEQAYISRCVDEAMREMGYDLLGSRDITRRSGKKFHNELYLFEEGTAVNVTYSGDGQISMELGGICREDRIPTDAESSVLAEDMHAFCDDYAELEKLLRKKGITTRRISLLPPDARYAQMINVCDYDLVAETGEFQVQGRVHQTGTAEKRQKGGQ